MVDLNATWLSPSGQDYPFLEEIDGGQILHDKTFVLPLRKKTRWELGRHPDTFQWFVDDVEKKPTTTAKYVHVLARSSKAIPRAQQQDLK